MSQDTTGALLPASINGPAAWAAFDHVQKLPWTLRFDTLDPLRLDVDYDLALQICLDGAGAFDFQKKARGHMAMRILEIAASFDESRLRLLGLPVGDIRSYTTVRAKALETIRDALVRRLRAELGQLLDDRADVWAEKLRTLLATLPPEEGRQVARYCGLDQACEPRDIRAGLNYVFKTLEPEIIAENGSLVLGGHERKLREAKAARSDPDPKARARNLVVRALDARLASIAPGTAGDLNSLLLWLESELRERVQKDGSWGLIDAVVERDRVMEGLTLPTALPSEVWDLVRQQERRFACGEA